MIPLTQHALFEMEKRGIPMEIVQAVWEQPQQKIGLATNREIWQNKINCEGKEFVLRIVVEPKPKPVIITVYKSSKVKKYWKEDE